MFELTGREQASLILLVVFVAVFVIAPKLRHQVGSGFLHVVRAFLAWKILVPLLIYIAYAAGIVYLAWRLDVWNSSQFIDTLIVVLFVGLPLFFSANNVRDGKKLIRDVIHETAGISTLLAFYVGSVSFPWWGELLIQAIIILLSLVAVVAQFDRETNTLGMFVNGALVLIGILLIVHTTMVIISTWGSDEWARAARSLLLSIWLPLSLIPIVYIFAFIIVVEGILIMLPNFNDRRRPKVRVQVASIWGLHFSTRLASEFNGRWRSELAQSNGLQDARRVMKEFRAAVKRRDQEMMEYKERLGSMAGVTGVDGDGLQVDRREFYATKKELDTLWSMQMGWYRNDSAYQPKLLEIRGDMTRRGLPAEHGIQLIVRKDGQAWRAWRRTPGGWYFGVGGTATPLNRWQYDGSTPPSGFPSEKTQSWVNATLHPSSIEWEKDDAPPTLN